MVNFGDKKQIKYPSEMKILLEFEKGLSPIYQQWTRDAVSEFIELFPAQKSLFRIEERKDNPYLNDALASQGNSFIDLGNLHMCYQAVDKDGATQYKVAVLSSQSKYEIGMGGDNCVVVAASNIGMKKKFFKNIIKHELGHTFGAVHRESNYTDTMGKHCNDYACLMSLGAYTEEGHDKFNDDTPFCSDCMQDMRTYMQELQKKCRGYSFGEKQKTSDEKSFTFGKKIMPISYLALKRGGLGE